MPKNKNNKIKNQITNNISLKSRKGKIIVSVFAFIVIGGGIMVYKSFASTNTVYAVLSCKGVTSPNTCTTVTDPAIGDPAGKGAINQAYEFTSSYKDPMIYINGAQGPSIGGAADGRFTVAPNQLVSYCAKVRPMDNVVLSVFGYLVNNAKGSWSLPALSKYGTYCTPAVVNDTGKNIPVIADVDISKGSKVRVAKLWAVISDPAPAPLPGK